MGRGRVRFGAGSRVVAAGRWVRPVIGGGPEFVAWPGRVERPGGSRHDGGPGVAGARPEIPPPLGRRS